MVKNIQSRKWHLVINNPLDSGLDHNTIKKQLALIKSMDYYCMGDEQGNTYHTHLFIICKNGIRFNRLKKLFPTAHIETAKGTAAQNRNYIRKSDKWANDEKHGTSIPDTFEESGDIPIENQGARNDLIDLYDSIKSGISTYEIIEQNPAHFLKQDKIEKTRQLILKEENKNKFRNLFVVYISGSTGTGKTRYCMEKNGYDSVYRVTDYKHPWDGYNSQKTIILEEFRSSFLCSDMLNYLDGYPLELPARFHNKQACYDKVYILSNEPFTNQYTGIKANNLKTYMAFRRRIHLIIEMDNLVATFDTQKNIFDAISNLEEITMKKLGLLPKPFENSKEESL